MTATTADAPGTPGAEASVLEVWGDPIAHSLSPRLHAAAYRELGWAWQYGRRRVAVPTTSEKTRSAFSEVPASMNVSATWSFSESSMSPKAAK